MRFPLKNIFDCGANYKPLDRDRRTWRDLDRLYTKTGPVLFLRLDFIIFSKWYLPLHGPTDFPRWWKTNESYTVSVAKLKIKIHEYISYRRLFYNTGPYDTTL